MRISARSAERWGLSILALVLGGVLAFRLFPPVAEAPQGVVGCEGSALWIQHGWLATDAWFERQGDRKRPEAFRGSAPLAGLAARLQAMGARQVYPHIGPIDPSGEIPRPDVRQARALRERVGAIAILPWVGGVLGDQVFPDDPTWRDRFVESAARLFDEYPMFDGMHLNIEPWPPEEAGLEALLVELRARWPRGKILSLEVPAVSSPLGLGFRCALPEEALARLGDVADELVVALYNTGAVTARAYAATVAKCTRLALLHGRSKKVWIGVPDFPDEGGYHDASVETAAGAMRAALAAVASTTAEAPSGPRVFAGFALYAEWTATSASFGELEAWARSCR
jgi:hypothetical protein